MTQGPESAILYLRIGLFGAIWIPLLNLHFYLSLFSDKSSKYSRFVKLAYLCGIIISMSDFTPYFIASVEPKLSFPTWPNPGIFFHFYFFYFFILVLATFYFLGKRYQESNTYDKKIISWIFISNLILYGCGSLNFLLWYDILIPPVLNIFTSLSFGIITCILLNFKIIDVNSMFRKISLLLLIYGILLAITIPSAVLFSSHLIENRIISPALTTVFLGGIIGLILSFGPFIYAYLIKSDFWLKGQLSMGFTHELKSPLANIRSAAEVLIEEFNKEGNREKKHLEYMDIIISNTDRIENQVSQLLAISKIQHGQIDLEKSSFNLSNLILTTGRTYNHQAQTRNLNITYNIPEGLTFYGDKEKIQQIFSNLISNAIKFSKTSSIQITLNKSNEYHSISIKDQGKGILKKDLSHIFQRFYQGKNSVKGSGIGLSIAKAWVEAHGGKIWAESEGEGRGTKISFTLPGNL